MKKILIRVLVLVALIGGAWYGYGLFKAMPQRQVQVATTKVRKGEVVVRTFSRGELRAVRSATLSAPNLFGTVQVTRLASLGSLAKDKDLIVEFDDAEVQSRLEEKQLELDQTDEQIKKSQADLAIRNNQDQVELLKARYSVRRAELEVKRNELLPQIDQRKNELNLEESRRRLKQLESDIQSRREQSQAELAVLAEKKRKGQLEMARERQRLLQVRLLSPMAGLIAIRQNRQGGFFFPGMQIPDVREGDQVQPGMPIADVLDLSELEVVAKVGELDRANLQEGQEVNIKLDTVGDKTFRGKIKNMSGTASANIFSGDPAKKFDVVFSVDMKELLSGLGAKPEQINKIMAQAEANRRKPPSQGIGGPMMLGGGGAGGPAGSAPQMVMVAAPAGGASGPPSGTNMIVGMPGATPGGPAARTEGQNGGQNAGPGQRTPAPGATVAGAQGPQAGRPPAMVAGGAPRPMGPGGGMYSEKDLANAKLPPPVDPENQLEVLLRPGLLADVEIILEKVPNAINIPNQAVFEKDGKQIVYVHKGNAWEERVIKPAKRSESVMIIASGVSPGEVVALADPTAKPGDKKKKSAEKSGGSSAVGSLPGGGRS